MSNTGKEGVVFVLNNHTGNFTKTLAQSMRSLGVYECTAETEIIVNKGTTSEVTIITQEAFDDAFYNGILTIEINTVGTFNLVVRG